MVTNKVIVDAEVISEPVLQATYGVEHIYEVIVRSKRISGAYDEFYVSYSNGLGVELHKGDFIFVTGDLRSIRVKLEDSGSITKVFVKASSIEVLDSEPEDYRNEVTLDGGELAKDVLLRKSFKDDSIDISTMVVKLSRGYSKSSYIPCSAWNNNARLVADLKRGSKVNIIGRIQSHRTSNDRLMFEVSISFVSVC